MTPVSRRAFLDKLLFTSLSAAAVTALAPVPFFLRPPPSPRPPRVKIGKVERSGIVSFVYGGRGATAIVAENKDVRVLSHRCTHQGCDVKLNSTELRFECPCHGAIFDLQGAPVRGPHNGPLASIPYRIVDGELEVGE